MNKKNIILNSIIILTIICLFFFTLSIYKRTVRMEKFYKLHTNISNIKINMIKKDTITVESENILVYVEDINNKKFMIIIIKYLDKELINILKEYYKNRFMQKGEDTFLLM